MNNCPTDEDLKLQLDGIYRLWLEGKLGAGDEGDREHDRRCREAELNHIRNIRVWLGLSPEPSYNPAEY